MSEVLKAVNEILDCLTHQVVSLTRQLDIVTTENITLKKKVIVLEARLAEYETPKDSHNSSTPPSKESIKAQTLRAHALCERSATSLLAGKKGIGDTRSSWPPSLTG